jgi:hypothetical protein
VTTLPGAHHKRGAWTATDLRAWRTSAVAHVGYVPEDPDFTPILSIPQTEYLTVQDGRLKGRSRPDAANVERGDTPF